MTGPAATMDNTMGIALVRVVVAASLLGIGWLQAFYYYINYRGDPKYLRYGVLFAVVFDTIHQALITHTVYVYLVTNYNNNRFLGECVWSLLAEVLFNGFSAFIVQSFLATRVWHLSKNIYLTGTVMALVLGELGCITIFGVIGLVKIHTFDDLKELQALSISVNALAAIGDVLIACSLSIFLQKSKTGFKRSDTMLQRLILFAVHTGSVTTVFAIASLVSITVAPNTFCYIFFFFCIGRLYTNSFLATLNARRAIRTAGEPVNTTSNLSFAKLFGKQTIGTAQTRKTDISIVEFNHNIELISDESTQGKSQLSPCLSSPSKQEGISEIDSEMDGRSHFEDDYKMEVRDQQSNMIPRVKNVGPVVHIQESTTGVV
ncbi:hypothetical protein K435DRAFT_789450 [Dendrothele bispora CBS 962.96]|uniref:DUF6534 domain-containing protein n=1 Tax=Dendrothele bispora (strain CBS 962.96) TaxID=1314807 RepID=A0A4V4HIF1_DENBC|nr:hypothetical protein K435DRAFT_789450 [Dendrothele bispora CBS 962.96]